MAHELPGPEIRFAYAESPAKQWRDSDVRDTAHNPNELRRIRILLPVVCVAAAWARAKRRPRLNNHKRARPVIHERSWWRVLPHCKCVICVIDIRGPKIRRRRGTSYTADKQQERRKRNKNESASAQKPSHDVWRCAYLKHSAKRRRASRRCMLSRWQMVIAQESQRHGIDCQQ